jgi:transposase
MRWAPDIYITDDDREILEDWASHPRASIRLRLRSQIILEAASGATNQFIAVKLATSPATVARWRNRFAARGLIGIKKDAPRSGRPPKIDGETLALITWNRRIPDRVWTDRSMAAAFGISRSSVRRAWCLIDAALDEERRQQRERDLVAASVYQPARLPTYSPAQLDRARQAHSVLQTFLGLSFADFVYYLLDGGEYVLQGYERAAVAYEKYEAKHGLLAGKVAHEIGHQIVSISCGWGRRPVEMETKKWDELVLLCGPVPSPRDFVDEAPEDAPDAVNGSNSPCDAVTYQH